MFFVQANLSRTAANGNNRARTPQTQRHIVQATIILKYPNCEDSVNCLIYSNFHITTRVMSFVHTKCTDIFGLWYTVKNGTQPEPVHRATRAFWFIMCLRAHLSIGTWLFMGLTHCFACVQQPLCILISFSPLSIIYFRVLIYINTSFIAFYSLPFMHGNRTHTHTHRECFVHEEEIKYSSCPYRQSQDNGNCH